MDNSKTLGGLVLALVLGTAACGRSNPEAPPAATLTVAGNSEAVNSFVAEVLVKKVSSKMTVAHRGDGLIATLALAGYGGDDVMTLTKQALAHHLSYTVTGVAIRG